MSAPADGPTIRVRKPTLRGVLAAPIRLQSYLNLVYLSLTFPLGLAYFIFFSVGLSLSAGLSILLVGIPMFVGVLVVAHVLAVVERVQARTLLRVPIDRPPIPFLENDGVLDRAKGLVLDDTTLKAIIHHTTKLAVGVASFTLLVSGIVTSAVFVAVPLYYDRPGVNVGVFPPSPIEITSQIYVPWDDLLVGVEAAFRITELRVDTIPEALVMSAFGVIIYVAFINVANALAWAAGEYADALLGGGRVRDITVEVVS